MKLLGFESIQARDIEGNLVTGALHVGDDGVVRFVSYEDTDEAASPAEAVKGSLGEFEEVEQPVEAEPDTG